MPHVKHVVDTGNVYKFRRSFHESTKWYNFQIGSICIGYGHGYQCSGMITFAVRHQIILMEFLLSGKLTYKWKTHHLYPFAECVDSFPGETKGFPHLLVCYLRDPETTMQMLQKDTTKRSQVRAEARAQLF
jgi:hypothetical protein